MERDFMGLNSKDPLVVVKEEVVESSQDSGFHKGSGVPWPSLSKVSALPHFMPFKNAQDEKPPKFFSDHPVPPGFMPMPSADGYDLTNKYQPAEFQNMHSSPLSHDIKMLSYSIGNPFFKTRFSSGVPNFSSAAMKEQFLGGIPLTNPHPILPSSGFVAGTTEPRINPKASGAPAQLTIFYAGNVNVYDDISPEKAQAIMFLAANGSLSSNLPPQHVQVQPPVSKLAAADGAFLKKNFNTPPCSALSSPMAVSSHPISQMTVGSIKNEDLKASKTVGVSGITVSKVETPKKTSLGPVAANTIVPSAVPQARKASLARFLEKRKERVMTSSPYKQTKKSAENNNLDYANFSTSGAGSSNMSTGNEINR